MMHELLLQRECREKVHDTYKTSSEIHWEDIRVVKLNSRGKGFADLAKNYAK